MAGQGNRSGTFRIPKKEMQRQGEERGPPLGGEGDRPASGKDA